MHTQYYVMIHDNAWCFTATVKDVRGNDVLLNQRKMQLQKRKVQYPWKKLPETGLPSCIDDTSTLAGFVNTLPREEKFDVVKSIDFTTTALEDGAKLLLQSISIEMKHLHDYELMATVLGNPEISVHNAARWTTDVEFGRQMLNGVNPVVIKKCTKLPIVNFPITNEMVKGFLNRGLTLDEEIEVSIAFIHVPLIVWLMVRLGLFTGWTCLHLWLEDHGGTPHKEGAVLCSSNLLALRQWQRWACSHCHPAEAGTTRRWRKSYLLSKWSPDWLAPRQDVLPKCPLTG